MSPTVHTAIKEIWQEDPRTLAIIWTDNKESHYDVVALRRQCPCAECIDENTGKRKFDPQQIDESVRPMVIRSVGRYAMAIEFTDGHRTGIYSFDTLRRIGTFH
jgi:DUF971 family protein